MSMTSSHFTRVTGPFSGPALTATAMAAALLCACGAYEGSEPTPPTGPDPGATAAGAGGDASTGELLSRVQLPEIERAMRGPVDIEALSESLDGWLGTLGNKVRIRDFDGIRNAFVEDFQGERLFPVEPEGIGAEVLPLGVKSMVAPEPTEALDRDGFMGALESSLSPWARVSQSSWRLADSTFQDPGRKNKFEWGLADVRIHIVGQPEDGGTLVLDALATASVKNEGGKWRISRFRVTERKLLLHEAPMFSEVSRAVGVAFDGLRFGEPGNDRDGWNGVAAADVDGDELIDIFVPGARQSFLYRADGQGSFVDEAKDRGLDGADGGTGAVFFDYDRDGDQDLAVAFVGWRKLDDSPAGRSVSIFQNDGRGYFTEVTRELGLSKHRIPAYSLTAFDADGDGWTDLFVCGYGRMEDDTNDSWLEASNGSPDLLLRNVEGERFKDVTMASGLEDRRWSYASAAADYDEDGDLDLFVGNNFGTSRLWRNRGDGTFEDVAEELGVNVRGNVMGVLWTDIDGDGRLDLYLSSPTSTSGSRIIKDVEAEFGADSALGMMQMANGNKLFMGGLTVAAPKDGTEGAAAPEGTAPEKVASFQQVDVGGIRAGWSWSAASPDVDLDGNRDIVCVNGFVTGDITGDT